MSGYTFTQTELLYAMPAAGPAVTAATSTRISAGATTTNPPYQLPAYFVPATGGIGKSILLKGGGWFSVGSTAVTDVFTVGLNTSPSNTTAGITVAKTGTFTTVASVTDGAFEFEVMMTAASAGTGTSATWNAVGHLLWGPANNAAAPTQSAYSATLSGQPMMIGAPQTPVTFDSTVAYNIELYNTWSVTTGAPTITLTNFLIFGLN